MLTCVAPNDYFGRDYLADFEVFGGNMMCGFTLTDSLCHPKRTRFRGLAEFVLCQYELNLLNQAIYAHSPSAHSAWRAFSAPFADTRLCSHGHGMGCHLPWEILRFAQQPSAAPNTVPVPITWKMLHDYSKFFLDEYVSRFTGANSSTGFSREAFLQAVARDHDCTACVFTPSGWETQHVMKLLR